MGKKNKAKRKAKKSNAPVQQDVSRDSGFHVINRIVCVECYMDKQLKPIAVCELCEHHKGSRCQWGGDRFRIKIVSPNEPMRFNRMAFSVGSEGIRDDSRNYYFLTDIMQPTKCIVDCSAYVELKAKLLSGELWEMEEQPERRAELAQVLMTLVKTDEVRDAIFFDNGIGYKEDAAHDLTGKSLPIKFFLYDMYSMGGLADVMIDGRFYKVRKTPIEGAVESLVMISDGPAIHIGRRQA